MPKPDASPTPEVRSEADCDLFATAPLPVAPLNDAQRLACLRLIRSENVGPVTFRQLINTYGGAEEALDALSELAHRSGRKRELILCSKDRAEAELTAADKAGATPLFTIEPGFPKRLALLDVPPPMIYAVGRLDLLNAPSIAIVGARQSSAAGQKLARMFAQDLAKAGLVVISGLARGIDGAAHAGSLDTGTIAVVAGGVDVIYPPEHDDLHAQIAKKGCIISEMPCGFRPRGKDFPRRNRLISGTALGVLVIEAAKRSGTLVTARMAGEQGREVFAVPGHPLDPRAQGTNLLLKNGATLVTEAADVIAALKPMTASPPGTFQEPTTQSFDSNITRQITSHPTELPHQPEQQVLASPPPAPMSDDNARITVMTAIGPAPVDIDDIVRATGLSARQVNAVLLELDIAGQIDRHGANLVSARQLP